MQNPPFYYKVSFHFLAKDEDNEIIHENWQKEFIDANPDIARKDAFKAFKAYLKFIENNDRFKLDEIENPKIISPSDIPQNAINPEDVETRVEDRIYKLIREHFKYDFKNPFNLANNIQEERMSKGFEVTYIKNS